MTCAERAETGSPGCVDTLQELKQSWPEHHIVDARHLRCPMPALRLARAMRSHARVLLVFDDPQVPAQCDELAAHHGWRLLPHCLGALEILQVEQITQGGAS